MVRKVILCLSIIFFCFCRVMAQSADTLSQPDIYYSSPKTYEIAGIEVTGIGEQYDPETLILATGLRVGSEVKIPGDAITKAIRRLYGQGLFSDVTISVDRVEGQKVFLIINLAERHRLSAINYIGLKKSEESKIKEKINQLPGSQVTDNMIAGVQRIIEKYFKEKGFYVVKLDARRRNSMKEIQNVILEACKEKIERDRRRGIKNRPVRAMVVGIPNVGKSTFINTFAGKACAKTGNKPGVTKGKQWIRLNKDVELLDTPGILWPKFDDQMVGLRLALIGSIKDEILNIDELSLELISYLKENYAGTLAARYEVEETVERPVELLEAIAQKRGCVQRGNEIDYSKAAALVIDDFRSGRLGRITLELPEAE